MVTSGGIEYTHEASHLSSKLEDLDIMTPLHV